MTTLTTVHPVPIAVPRGSVWAAQAAVAAACDGGITIDSGSVGAVFNAAPGTDFTLATPTNQFKAVTSTGVAAPNTVIAQPRNTTGTDIFAPLMARFRLAAWGSAPWSNPADTGRWKDMRGAEGGICGAGTAPNCTPIRIPASGGGKAAITFQWQIGNDPTLGPSEYCKYGLTPPAATGVTCGPCTCGASCDAPGTGVQATGFPCVTPTYQYDQCMLVELSAPNGVANFASQSTWNNMTFSQMSVMSREALIDARDLPKAPGQREQDIYLIAMPRNMPAKLAAPTDGSQLVRQQAFDRALAISAPYAEDFDKLTPEQIREIADKLGHPLPGPNHDDVGHANPLARKFSISALVGFSMESSFWRISRKAGSVGLTLDGKRATISPLRSIRNFSKFHLISPAFCGLDSLSVRNL